MGDRPEEFEHRCLTLTQFIVWKKYDKEDSGSLRGSSYLIPKKNIAIKITKVMSV